MMISLEPREYTVVLIDDPAPHVRRITMNRPEKRNALNHALRGDILHALLTGDADPDVRVQIVRGAGPSFSAGYDIGGGNEVRNVDLTHRILELTDKPASLIQPVEDRPGHDRRYALDTAKLQSLGWKPQVSFDDGLAETVRWYTDQQWWWRPIREQVEAFRSYYPPAATGAGTPGAPGETR